MPAIQPIALANPMMTRVPLLEWAPKGIRFMGQQPDPPQDSFQRGPVDADRDPAEPLPLSPASPPLHQRSARPLAVPGRAGHILNLIASLESSGLPLNPLDQDHRVAYREHMQLMDNVVGMLPQVSTLQAIKDQYYDVFELVEGISYQRYGLRMVAKAQRNPLEPNFPELRYHGLHLMIFGPNGAYEHWRFKADPSIDIRRDQPLKLKERTNAFADTYAEVSKMRDWLDTTGGFTGAEPPNIRDRFDCLFVKPGTDGKDAWGIPVLALQLPNRAVPVQPAHEANHPAGQDSSL